MAAGDRVLVSGGFANGDVTAYDAHTGDERWRYRIGGTAFIHAANDQVAIVSPHRGHAIAVDVATGAELWRFGLTPDETPQAATIVGDTVFFGTSVTYEGAIDPPAVYAVDLGTGEQRWRTALNSGTQLEWGSPTVQGGLVIVADTPAHPSAPTSTLHVLDAITGAVRWKADLRTGGQGFHTERPVVVDGVVHAVNVAGEILAFDAVEGNLLWFDALGAALPHIAGAANGLVYVAFSDGVRAFDQRTGRRAWEVDIGTAALALGGGTLYAGGGASLHALVAATGVERWRHPQTVGWLAIAGDTLVLASRNDISAIEAASGRVMWSGSLAGIDIGPVVVDGVVVVGTTDGDLVAFALGDLESALPSASTTSTSLGPSGVGPSRGVIAYAETFEMLRVVDLGKRLSAEIELPANGYPERPFVSGDSFVFLAAGAAWATGPVVAGQQPSSGYTSLGAASHVIPSDRPDAVWLVRGEPPDPVEVQLTDLSGQPMAEPVVLPSRTAATAAVTDGLLLDGPDGMVLVFDPATNTTTFLLGVADVIDTHGSLVAWLPRADCGVVRCPLHLTDVATGDDQLVDAPATGDQWVHGGAISPEGRTLAAFVDASPATFPDGFSGPGAALVLVDIPTATVTRTVDDSVVAVGEPVVAAAWSPTSGWLFFSGLRDPMRAYEPGSSAAVPLSLPASYASAVA